MAFNFYLQPGQYRKNFVQEEDFDPKISIITPFYNSMEFFKQTFNCVVDQTFPWFEWIIADDGSSESELEKLNELVGADKRIKVYTKDKNEGPAATRNFAASRAQSEYLLFLDSDDLIEPTFLEYSWWMLEHNKDAAWAITKLCGFGDKEYEWDVLFDPSRIKDFNTLHISCLVRKTWFDKVGGYAVHGKHYDEDWNLWLSIMAEGGYPVQSRREVLAWYRVKSNGSFAQTHDDEETIKRNNKIIRKTASNIFELNHAIVYPDANHTSVDCQLHKRKTYEFKKVDSSKKQPVLFVLSKMDLDEVGNFNLDLIKGLDKEKYNVVVVTTEVSDNELLQQVRQHIDEIFNLPNFMTQNDYFDFVDYLIQTRNIKTVFVSNSHSGYYMLPQIRKCYKDISIIDYVYCNAVQMPDGGALQSSAVMGNLLDKTYVSNCEINNTLVGTFARQKKAIEIVHMGVDVDKFDPALVKKGIARKQLGIEKTRPVVLYSCKLEEKKRPLLMIEIAQRVAREIPDVAFVVVGNGEYKRKCKKEVQSRHLGNNVYFVEQSPDVRPCYRDATVLLVCSSQEDLSLTTCEAMAMGVPVVSSDVGSQRDLVDESVGKIVPFLNNKKDFCGDAFAQTMQISDFTLEEVEKYASAIVEIISAKKLDESTYEKMSEGCRKKIIDKFNAYKFIEFFNNELVKIYNDKDLEAQRADCHTAINKLGLLADDVYVLDKIANSRFEQSHTSCRSSQIYDDEIVALKTLSELVNQQQQAIAGHEEVLNRHEEVVNRHEDVVNRHEEVVNRHEEVLNRHEDVVNRHEDVVNRHEETLSSHKEILDRHEDSINHQWGVQKWHEERIKNLENKRFRFRR